MNNEFIPDILHSVAFLLYLTTVSIDLLNKEHELYFKFFIENMECVFEEPNYEMDPRKEYFR